jgi:transcription antitermination factor NusG
MGYEVFLPVYHVQRKWSDRVKEVKIPLFSGYFFCSMDLQNRLPVLRAPGVVSIVGFGRTAIPVPDDEIAAVQAMVDSNLSVQPWPYVQTGDRVRLQRGPLAGIEGIVVQLKSCMRLVVRINLLQRAVAADVDPDWVKVIDSGSSLCQTHTPTRSVLPCAELKVDRRAAVPLEGRIA